MLISKNQVQYKRQISTKKCKLNVTKNLLNNRIAKIWNGLDENIVLAYKRYRNLVNAIIRRQKNAAYKQFFCNNNCSDMWIKIKKLTDHKQYNTIPDDIFYGNNTFSKCERINAFNKFFSSIATR